MKTAITGATGFVGRTLFERLLASGASMTCLARSAERARPLADRGADIVEGDLEDPGALARLVRGADVVLHVAALVKARTEEEFLRVNRDGSARLAAVVREAGVPRFVMVSSLAVTGPATSENPAGERTTARPLTPYGRSKLAAEEAVRQAEIPHVVVRPPAVYGPGDQAFLPLFKMARLGVASVFRGDQELNLIHVRDLADAILACASSSTPADGRIYHAAHPEVLRQRSLVQAVARAVGRDRVHVLPIPSPIVRPLLWLSALAARLRGQATQLAPHKAPEFLAPGWVCSNSAIERDTGWRAAISLEMGLAETAAWYRGQGWL